MPKGVVVITGPTATGKTKLGIELAKKFDGEVISADSMQLYKYMDIGTATPDAEEMEGIPHHMLSIIEPREDYSVSLYVEAAAACVDDVIARGKMPIIVGGTGLYIDSLLSGRGFMGGDAALREKFSQQYDEEGGEAMLRLLAEVDSDSAQRLHANDKKRIVRALEVYHATGKSITQHNIETQSMPPRYNSCKIALSFEDRADLYNRIDRRVDLMMEMGLVAEVEKLISMGVDEKSTAMQAIGYKEIVLALRGECSMEEAVETVKRESRRYAKRQLSWLSSKKDVNWIRWKKQPDLDWARQLSTSFMENNGIITEADKK
ncbi:MAG: tRNA (adenosine(37)-N6)-dimethylallyltransferase MiaA [Oscillospiraceae bacterium]|nr:tRNA (adenosine(37)-N6)-dimethylallyltransferase MiaA [Oscillospiraceae bacterium]